MKNHSTDFPLGHVDRPTSPFRWFHHLVLLSSLLVLVTTSQANSEEVAYQTGAARMDITPAYPVRLSGFGFRRAESDGVTQRIWAKALAVDDQRSGPAILITVDNLGIPADMTLHVARELQTRRGIDPKRVSITATHTHSAPMLRGVAPTLFGVDIPKEHQQRIDRYSDELTHNLVTVAESALDNRQPGTLAWGIGSVGFAVNRRTKDGPVDHDLPVLVVRNSSGAIRAVYCSYACHCVTLSANQINGDWAGYAQAAIESNHPDAVALVSIGCGADANPRSGVTGDNTGKAGEQGALIAAEVNRLIASPDALKPITAPLSTYLEGVSLPFDQHPTRTEWEQKSEDKGALGYHARLNLIRLDRGQKLQTSLDYPLQTWVFGEQLAILFMPGEVVVDYALRLKTLYDRDRIWINAYANDAPCYIPSERILKEGGYEGSGAMIYYDRPTRFAAGLEQGIINTVENLIPGSFRADSKTQNTHPKSPEESLQCMAVNQGLEVELAVAEPLVEDPVAFEWDARGQLWVVEMRDYPLGMKGGYEPGGRIKILSDSDGDDRYDKAVIFADNLPFPTGILPWGDGAYICAAPDIIYAKDTNGDGKADEIRKLFTGFTTHNYQARVNSLQLGLDNWIYGANGLLGGVIKGTAGGKDVEIRNRDFKWNPSTLEFRAVAGLTQQGRARDDQGRWFGCVNGTLIKQYPIEEQFVSNIPGLSPPPLQAFTWLDDDPNQLFPTSEPLERFNDPTHLNRVTSACGLGIYRDSLLGAAYRGDAFVCEPVHNLVRRVKLTGNGIVRNGKRAADESNREFLASTDPWFRPAQVKTGPDGALWVADMYRFLMEHPIWIRPEKLATLDPRAGEGLGRLYRIYPKGKRPPLFQGWRNAPQDAVRGLASENGIQRDMAHQELLLAGQPEQADLDVIRQLAQTASSSEVRIQSLCVLDGIDKLTESILRTALADSDPDVRRHAVRLTGKHDSLSPELTERLLQTENDVDVRVKLQLACSLSKAPQSPETSAVLARVLLKHRSDPYLSAACLNSGAANSSPFVAHLLSTASSNALRDLWTPLVEIAVANRDWSSVGSLATWGTNQSESDDNARNRNAVHLLQSLNRHGQTIDHLLEEVSINPAHREGLRRVAARPKQARTKLLTGALRASEDGSLIPLLGWSPDEATVAGDIKLLARFVSPQQNAPISLAAIERLREIQHPEVGRSLATIWSGQSPTIRTRIAEVLLARASNARTFLEAIQESPTSKQLVSPDFRTRLLAHSNQEVRHLAARVFERSKEDDRQAALQRFREAKQSNGNAFRGENHYAERCAVCHEPGSSGNRIGPDLRELTDRSDPALLQAIIDPNRRVHTRYVSYELETRAGSVHSGMITSEDGSGINLVDVSGNTRRILRTEITSLRSTGRSLMPEGLEADWSVSDMADLIRYVANIWSATPQPASTRPRDPRDLAAYLLNEQWPLRERVDLLRIQYSLDHEVLRHLVRAFKNANDPNESNRAYQWLRRLGAESGKRNEVAQIRRLLEIALPVDTDSVKAWQIGLLGGGILRSFQETDLDPAKRLASILQPNPILLERWLHWGKLLRSHAPIEEESLQEFSNDAKRALEATR